MVWDKTLPIEGALAPTYNDIMRADKTALEAALNAYMYFVTGGVQTGQPRQGSARSYYQDAIPTVRLDGDHFDSTDIGCLWIDSNSTIDNQFNWLSAADGAGTNTWTPVSTEVIATLLAAARVFASTLGVTGNFAVNTDKFTVTAANGNTLVAGTLDVTGNLDPTAFEVTNGGFIDEDTMATDSAVKAPSQQSVKAHVAAAIAQYIVLKDVKTAGTLGGSAVADTWTKRDIAEITDPDSLCAVSSSVIVLSAGTYFCRISAPAFQVNAHQIRLRNTTGASTLLTGTSEDTHGSTAFATRSFIMGEFTVAAAQNLEIQHNVETANADDGFGTKADFTGVESDVYTIAEFWKVG